MLEDTFTPSRPKVTSGGHFYTNVDRKLRLEDSFTPSSTESYAWRTFLHFTSADVKLQLSWYLCKLNYPNEILKGEFFNPSLPLLKMTSLQFRHIAPAQGSRRWLAEKQIDLFFWLVDMKIWGVYIEGKRTVIAVMEYEALWARIGSILALLTLLPLDPPCISFLRFLSQASFCKSLL